MKNRLSIREALKIFIKNSFYCGIVVVLFYWFMKIIGFQLIGIDLNNRFFNDLDNLLNNNYWLKQIYFSILLYFQFYFMICMINKEKGKRNYIYILCFMPIFILTRFLTSQGNLLHKYSMIIEFIVTISILSKFNYKNILKTIIVTILNIIYQMISISTRNLSFVGHNELGFVAEQILCLDYYILLFLSKEVCTMDGGTFFFFGFTAWLYRVAGFIVGLFTLHPIKKSREWHEKGKAKEDARKAKKATR